MRKAYTSTYTGTDTLTWYDMGDDTLAVVHVQEWEDLVGEREAAEIGCKYNVVAHVCPVYGFDGQRIEGNDQLSLAYMTGIGQSVHDSLRSCGYVILPQAAVGGVEQFVIVQSYDAQEIARGPLTAQSVVGRCVAECMYGYGAGDRMCDISGNNKTLLARQAKHSL